MYQKYTHTYIYIDTYMTIIAVYQIMTAHCSCHACSTHAVYRSWIPRMAPDSTPFSRWNTVDVVNPVMIVMLKQITWIYQHPQSKKVLAILLWMGPSLLTHVPFPLNNTALRNPNFVRIQLVFNRKKFRSQTSVNMDRWKRRGGKNQRREEKKKAEKRRERVRRKKM